MPEPKRITREGVAAALDKAVRYRLLNEPLEAESICCDVLEVEPDNQNALVTLLLALTDQFDTEYKGVLERAKEVVPRLGSQYEREYYEGIINERWGKAQLSRGMPSDFVLGWFREAMRCYERAEKVSDASDPDAVLRWNTCLRFLQRHENVNDARGTMDHDVQGEFGDDVPLR